MNKYEPGLGGPLKVRLSEVFTSVEGEGTLCGTKTLFVRMAGCPFECFYCDTPDSLPLDSGTEYEVGEACGLIGRSLQPNTYKVNFTGGDPLAQHEALAEMARFVRSTGVPTYIESSCYDSGRFAAVAPLMDFVKIELKTIDSGFVRPESHGRLVQSALECLAESVRLGKTTYVKIVVSARTAPAGFGELAEGVFRTAPAAAVSGFVIQPTHGVAEPPLDLLLRLYDLVRPLYPEVRIVPQLHKMIGAP